MWAQLGGPKEVCERYEEHACFIMFQDPVDQSDPKPDTPLGGAGDTWSRGTYYRRRAPLLASTWVRLGQFESERYACNDDDDAGSLTVSGDSEPKDAKVAAPHTSEL